MASVTYHFESVAMPQRLFGPETKNLELLESTLRLEATARDGWIQMDGAEPDVQRGKELFEVLEELSSDKGDVRSRDFRQALNLIAEEDGAALRACLKDRVHTSSKKGWIHPKTPGQKRYLDAIRDSGVTLGIGPAGTGKTYLAMAMGVSYLKQGAVDRLVLCRPAVEAGEALGYLPGDLREKISPYLRPLFDALHDMLPDDELERNQEKGVIEIAPLAYMRGRTLNNAFIILDEGQNTTKDQMFMFLTRMGHGSRIVVTGDLTQVDLPREKLSGLREARSALADVDGVSVVELGKKDVVRHPLVQRIIQAYETSRGSQDDPRVRT